MTVLAPKMMGKVGIDTSELKKNADSIIAQFERMEKSAKELSLAMASIGSKKNQRQILVNATDLSRQLNNIAKEMYKKVEDLERRHTQNLSSEQKKQLKNLKDNLRAESSQLSLQAQKGKITAQKYLEESKALRDKALATGKLSAQEMVAFDRNIYTAQNMIARQSTNTRLTEERRLTQGVNAEQRARLTQQMRNENQRIQMERQTNARLLAEQKKVDAQLRAELKKYATTQAPLGSTQQRFNSLISYAFSASIIYGALRGLKSISSAIKDIEQQSIQLARVMPNSTAKVVDDLRKNAFETAKLSAQEVGDVQKIQNLWARTSDEIAKNKDAMEELTRVTAIGMNVGGFDDAEQAVTLLNATINQMGLKWSDAKSVMDSWIKTADTSAVKSAKDLADVTMKVGTQAQQLGLTYYDLNGITAVLSNNMAKSGMDIGTAMKTVFSYFQDEKTIKVLHKYGVEVKKNAKEYNDFVQIMENLNKRYTELRLDNNQQAMHEIDNALGRIRRVDFVGTLISNWDEFKAQVKTSMDSANYSFEQNEKITKSLASQIEILKVEFQEMAWAIGESGLLEELKGFIKLITSGMQAFSDLDPSAKRAIIWITELGIGFTVLNQMMKLVFGKGTINLIANVMAEIAYNTKNATISQALFNTARMNGANIELIEAGVRATNTASIQANTIARSANVIVSEEGQIIGQQTMMAEVARLPVDVALTGAINAETGAQNSNNIADEQGILVGRQLMMGEVEQIGVETALTGATIAETEAQLTLNNTRLVGAGLVGGLAGIFKSLLNPINLVMIGIVGLTTAFFVHKQRVADAKAELERFKDAQKGMAEMLSKEVVNDVDIVSYQKTLGQLEEIRDGIKKNKQIINSMSDDVGKYANVNVNNLRGISVEEAKRFSAVQKSSKAYEDAEDEIESYNKKLRELGITEKELGGAISKLTLIVNTSVRPEVQKAYNVISKIKKELESNTKMRAIVLEYKHLSEGITNSAQVTARLRDLTVALKDTFPTYADGIDKITGLTKMKTDAILKEILVVGKLTDAQLEEITMTAQLDTQSKNTAIAMVRNQIAIVKATRDATAQRLQNMKAEYDMLFTLEERRNKFSFGVEKFNRIMGTNPLLRTSEDKEWVLQYGRIRGQLTDSLGKNTIELPKLDDKISELESVLKIVSGIKPFKLDTPLAGDGGKDGFGTTALHKVAEKFVPDINTDKYATLNRQLEMAKTNVERIKALEETTNVKYKVMYTQQENKALREQQNILREIQKAKIDEGNQLKKKLGKDFGFTFNDDGEIKNYYKITHDLDVKASALQKQADAKWKQVYGMKTGDAKTKATRDAQALEAEYNKVNNQLKLAEKYSKNYFDVWFKDLPELSKDIADINTTIAKNTRIEIPKIIEEGGKKVEELQSKLVSALKKKYEEDKNNELKALKAKADARTKAHDTRISELDEEIAKLKDTREDDKKDIQSDKDKLTRLQEERSRWQRDDSIYAKGKISDLDEEIKKLQEEIEKKEKELKIKNLEAEKATEEKANKEISTEYEADKLKIENKYEKKLEEKAIVDEANKMILASVASGQGQIVQLLTSFAPTYSGIGTLLGSSLKEAMKAEVDDALRYWKQVKDAMFIEDNGFEYNYNPMQLSEYYKSKGMGYANGGLVDYTGIANVHGSASDPEYMLNATQTRAFLNLVSYLPKLNTEVTPSTTQINAPLIQNEISIVNNTPFDVSNNLDNVNRRIKNDLKNIGYKLPL